MVAKAIEYRRGDDRVDLMLVGHTYSQSQLTWPKLATRKTAEQGRRRPL
jgi:hypothetical protein